MWLIYSWTKVSLIFLLLFIVIVFLSRSGQALKRFLCLGSCVFPVPQSSGITIQRSSFSLWNGSFTFNGISLSPDALKMLNWHLDCRLVTISSVYIRIAWPWGSRGSLRVRIKGLSVAFLAREFPQPITPEEQQRQQIRETQRSNDPKLAAVDRLLWGTKRKWPSLGERGVQKCRRFAQRLLQDASLSLEDVSISFSTSQPVTVVHGSDPAGIPWNFRLLLRDVLVRSTSTNMEAEEYQSSMNLKGLSLEFLAPTLRPAMHRAARVPFSVLRRWGFTLQVTWSSQSESLAATATANALALCFNSECMKAILQSRASLITYLRHSSYQQIRPQVSVDTSPSQWWQHALRCITKERLSLLAGNPAAFVPSERRALRHAYMKAYLREKGPRSWLDLLRWPWKRDAKTLKELEGELTLCEIVRFRWWAWALVQATSPTKVLSAKLSDVLDVSNSRDTSSAKGLFSRMQLRFHCPRVSFIFHVHTRPMASHMSSASSLAAQSSPPSAFELCLRELHACALTQRQPEMKMAAGTLRMAFDGSIAEFTFRETEVGQQRSGASGSEAASSSHEQRPLALPSWLVMSPVPAGQTEHGDAFVRLQYRLPLLACEPSKCAVKIGGLDAVYCHLSLLRIASFLDEAWPVVPDLDPLAVKASVSLREVVAESVRASELQSVDLQSLLGMQVKVGPVRIMLPCVHLRHLERAPFPPFAAHIDEVFMSPAHSAAPQRQAFRVLVLTLGDLALTSGACAELHSTISAKEPLIAESTSGILETSMPAGGIKTVLPDVGHITSTADDPVMHSPGRSSGSACDRLQAHAQLAVQLADLCGGNTVQLNHQTTLLEPFTVDSAVCQSIDAVSSTDYRRHLHLDTRISAVSMMLSACVLEDLCMVMGCLNAALSDKAVCSAIKTHLSGIKDPQEMPGPQLSDPGPVSSSERRHEASGTDVSQPPRNLDSSLLRARQFHSTASILDSSDSDDKKSHKSQYEGAHQSRYGIGVTHQWTCPLVSIQVEQAGADASSVPSPGVFCLQLSALHTSVALGEGLEKDIRFSVGSLSLEDQGEEGLRATIIQPVPESTKGFSRRALMHRMFQVWRLRRAERSGSARQMHLSAEHLRIAASSQLSGYLSKSADSMCVSVEVGKILLVAVELATVERALLTACTLTKAVASGLDGGGLKRGQPHAAALQPNAAPGLDATTLQLEVHVHYAQIEASLGKQSFARVSFEDLGVFTSTSRGTDEEKVVISCSHLQVHDLLSVEERYSTVLSLGTAALTPGLTATWTKQLACHRSQPCDGFFPPEAPRPQTVIHASCTGVHGTMVGRFFRDARFFAERCLGMASAMWPARDPVSPFAPETSTYRTLIEVVLSDLLLDVPRHSWSEDFVRLVCCKATILTPVSTSFSEAVEPNMEGWSTGVADSSGTLHPETSVGGMRISGSSQGRGQREQWGDSTQYGVRHEDQFHHWHDSSAATTVLLCSAPQLYMGAARKTQPGLSTRDLTREIWSGADAVIRLSSNPCSVKVWVPGVDATFGCVEFEALMGIIWENMEEPCSFGPRAQPPIPIGRRLPPVGPQPEVLGVDRSIPPAWQVEVNVGTIAVAVGGVPPPCKRTASFGPGPSLARVRMRELQVTAAKHACGSLSVVVCSRTLKILDDRASSSASAQDHAIISIGQELPATSSGLRHVDSLHVRHRPRSSHASTHQGYDQAFNPPQSLARLSSLKWEPLNSGATHHSLETWRRTAESEATDMQSIADEDMDLDEGEDDEDEEGFYLEYVVQSGRPAVAGEPPCGGPHLLEIVGKGAHLCWPHLCQMTFITDIAAAFSHYFVRPWAAPNPEALGPKQWMYINVILERSNLLLPQGQSPLLHHAHSELAMPEDAGMLTEWKGLRIGYFWGGNNETILRINANDLSTACHDPTMQRPQVIVLPFQANAEVLWQRLPWQPQSTSATVRVSDLRIQPSFTSAPLLQAFMQGFCCPAVREEQAKVAASVTNTGTHPHPGSMRLDMMVHSFTAALIDDRCSGRIEVLTLRVQDMDIKFERTASQSDLPPETTGHVSLRVEVLFLNSAVDANEPMIEAWTVDVTYRHLASLRCLSLTSSQRLNLIATPAAFRSLGDLHSFLNLFSSATQQSPVQPAAIARRRAMQWLSQSTASKSTIYRLINRSGLRLSYWTRTPDGTSTVHMLNTWEESPLLVEPVEHDVMLAETQQQVIGRTICMQFEGSFAANCDVMVDKVGKYAYAISSPSQEAVTPIILDVALEGRTKVLTVHSPFRLENRTNTPLSFVVHTHGRTTTYSRAPHGGPLAPGSQCYLAVNSVWGGVLYLHAVDGANSYKPAKRDRITLNAANLKDAQGIYTCPATPHSSKPDFHCCLELQETQVLHQGNLAPGSFMEFMPEFTLSFQPPLTIRNCLPCEIIVTLTDSTSKPQEFSIGVGSSIEVYSYDLTRKINMAMQLQDYKSRHRVAIHYPPALGLDDSVRRSIVADLPGLRLAKDIILQKDLSAQGTPITSALGGSRLILRLHNRLNAVSKAREVVIFCPYWVVNKTNTTLNIKDTSPYGSGPSSIASPMADNAIAKPVLFSSPRGAMRICMHTALWSRSINLESVGMHGSIHILLPSQKTTGEKSVSGLRLLETAEVVGLKSRRLKQRDRAPAEAESTGPTPAQEDAQPQQPKHWHQQSDPGHLFASFNCAAAQGDDGAGESFRRKRYDLAIDASFGPDIFHRTKVITVSHKYVLCNTSNGTLQCGQRGTSTIWQLEPETRAPFHWCDAEAPLELCARPGTGQWSWSGAFQIGIAVSFGLRVFNSASKEYQILPVSISMQGASCVISLGNLHTEPPPYRIVNRCEALSLRFQQKDLNSASWDTVQAGQQLDYAFEEPLLPHKIRVVLFAENGYLDQAVHEYPLDIIKAHPVIKMKGSKRSNVVSKMAGTMGRALVTPLNLATGKPGSGRSPVVDQPEPDMRYVYVGLHADGPTRVLVFGDRKDQYTQGTNEDNMAVLAAKLARLEARLKDVNSQLQEVAGKQPHSLGIMEPRSAGRPGTNRLSNQSSGSLRPRQPNGTLPPQKTSNVHETIMRSGSSIPQVLPRLREGDTSGEQSGLRSLSAIGEAESEELSNRLPSISEGLEQVLASSHDGAPSADQRIASRGAFHGDMQNLASNSGSVTLEHAQLALAALTDPSAASLPASDAEMNFAKAIPESEALEGIMPSAPRPASEPTDAPRASTLEKQDVEDFFPPAAPDSNTARQGARRVRMLSLTRAGSLPTSNATSPATSPKFTGSPHAETAPPPSTQGRLSNALRRASVVLVRGSREERRLRFSDSTDAAVPDEKEDLLGGELLVRVEDAQGLYTLQTGPASRSSQGAEAPSEARAEPAGLGKGLGAHFKRKRGGYYCVMLCEGQVLRTNVVPGHPYPVWRHEGSFKSVQISSDLKVSVYRRARLGQDVFLGDVVVPLSEIDETRDSTHAAELRRYTLGRHSVKDKVSGEINLACCWRVTPQDVMTLRVRTLAAEVSQREEVLAVLAERSGQEDSGPSLADTGAGPEAQLHMGTRAADMKLARTSRGRLGVKVIEARGLTFPSEQMPILFGANLFAQANVTGDSSSVSARTDMQQGTMSPRWNQEMVFQDVALCQTLTLTVFVHRRLTADSALGQAFIQLDAFADGRPQYMWLPLLRPAKTPPGISSVSAGSLRVRVQWAAEDLLEASSGEAILPNLCLELALQRGIEVSVVEAGRLSLPREVAHLLLDCVEADFRQSPAGNAGRVLIRDIQIDNQLLTTANPVVLARASRLGHLVESAPSSPRSTRPFLEASWETLQHNPSILYFKDARLVLQEMDLLVEEEFLDVLVSLGRSLPLEDIWQTGRAPTTSPLLHQDQSRSALQDLLSASSTKQLGLSGRNNRKWYFEKLIVQEIRCNLTLIPRAGIRNEAAVLGRLKMAAALGIQFLDINNLPLRIHALPLQHAFVSPQSLYSIVTRHLIFQALQQMHKVLGQVDVLGTPIVLGSSLLSGISSLIMEPTKAHSPEEFFDGVFSGTSTLLRNTAFGFMNAFGQILGGAGKALAALTTDQEYINRFRTRPMTYRQNLLFGLQSAGIGFWEGAIGILKEPVVRWQDNGFLGISHGLYIGASGLFLKPTSGTLDLASKLLCGAGGKIKAWGDEASRGPPKTRVRNPRQFSGLAGDVSGDMRNLRQQRLMLTRLEKGRYSGDKVLDYLQNKDNKALILTDLHVLYIDLKRQSVRWAFSLVHLFSVSSSGLTVLLHHELTVRVGLFGKNKKMLLHVPARKLVRCRTRELHQSLLVKLGSCLLEKTELPPGSAPQPSAHFIARDMSTHMGDLHITNKPPPSSAPVDGGTARRPSALKRLSTFLRPSGPAAGDGMRAASLPASAKASQAPGPASAGRSLGAAEDADVSHGTGLLDARPPVKAAAGAASDAAAPSASSAPPLADAACSVKLDSRSGQAAKTDQELDAEAEQSAEHTSMPAVLRAVLLIVEESKDAPAARLRQSLKSIAELCRLRLSGREAGDSRETPKLSAMSALLQSVDPSDLEHADRRARIVEALMLLCHQ